MTRRAWLLCVVILGVAAFLRLWDLELRPPHHDEGVNGWFVEGMLKKGFYAYDPGNYHGPSYFYLLAGARKVFGFGLWQLRLPGALLGVALCFVPLVVRRQLGAARALAACALLATSPTLVYYARYAIHETLLAGLGLLAAACTLRWAASTRGRWLLLGAAVVALMVATKETTVLFLAVAGPWLVGEVVVESIRARRLMVLGHRPRWSWRVPAIALACVAVMLAIHVALFTGFFQAPGTLTAQLQRSVRAYFVWRDTGTSHGGHVKDACYYLHLGVRYELVLYLLAAVGLVAGFRERAIRGPGLVGFGMLAAYSAIAYKMPWLPMSWLALLALPAGHGAVVLGRVLAAEVSARLGTVAAVAVALVPALAITARASFVRPADKREALAYVHTDADYNRWFPLIEAGAARLGARRITVAVEHDAQWPLAWSLTRYPRTRWAATGDEDVLIVAVDRSAQVEARLRHAYLRRPAQLRDSAQPAFIYFRRDRFGQALAARIARGEFASIERAPVPTALAGR
ncbi:MAG: TIGR03663 family protein [Myxococcales bacterium]|nr:TIGR03663 family protein [Myxococcales bacterium]